MRNTKILFYFFTTLKKPPTQYYLNTSNTIVILMVKKKLTQDDFWAQQVIRAQSGGKDYIFALVRRKYSDDDIEPIGHGEYIGLKKTKNNPKIYILYY